MIAILRYALLKNMRDGSLAAFFLGPIVMLSAPLVGVAAFTKDLRVYPLSISPQWTAARSAAEMTIPMLFLAAFFATLAGFWGFRGEIVSRSMGSLVLALRPIQIQAATMLFGAVAGFAGFLGAGLSLFALMDALPPHPLRLLLNAAVLCLFGSAAGSLIVSFSSEPWAILPLYIGMIVVVPWLIKAPSVMALLIGLIMTVVCVALSALVLERRCAR